MFVSEDGYVTGSINLAQLEEIEPKSDEAKAQHEALKRDARQGQEQADRDADRLAELHQAQSIEGQRRDPVTTQGDKYLTPAAPAAQAATKQQDDAELARLQAEAEAAGVTVDKRWGADRLTQEIDAAKAAKSQQKKG